MQNNIIYLTETDSTNRYLMALSDAGEAVSGTVAVADFQTAGRGQTGNSWESEPEKNLLFSILYCPAGLPANMPFAIAEITSLAVKYTLDSYLDDITIKWPNDIYYRNNKICGMLIENIISEGKISKSVAGIGININQTNFEGKAPNPVSMAQVAGHEFDRQEVLNLFLKLFATQCARLDSADYDGLHRDYLNSIRRKYGFHRYADSRGEFEAELHDIEPTGHIILRRPDGTPSRYAFKEVRELPCICCHHGLQVY